MFKLPGRSVIKIIGQDAAVFLQGLISNDINKADGNLIYSFFLTPQGRFLADFFIAKESDYYLLDLPSSTKTTIINKLKIYKLRSQVVIEETNLDVAVADSGYADPRSALLGYRTFAEAAAIDEQAFAQYEALRISLLIPDADFDFMYEKSLPLDLGGEYLNGVDFKKGCYVGQEVTARMKHRGNIRKKLFVISYADVAPAYGEDVIASNKKIGVMLGSKNGQGLALLNFEDLGEDSKANVGEIEISIKL